ncbi:MAG: DMT family transporter, partial [Chloroflexi bacterium]|nr:DMT family transporter [Chloroflexota bacterium]
MERGEESGALHAKPEGKAHRRFGLLATGIIGSGILAVSSASVLIRLASAPPLAVGSWRLALATLLLTPIALPRLRREGPYLTRRDGLRIALAGLALAVHFASWITSLSYTTVASSVVLVSTNPIFVGLAAPWLLGEKVGRRTVWAIVLVLAGCVIVGYGDIDLSPRALLGDALALVGALGASAYILLGREVRRKLSTWAYVWPCYGVAALALIAFTLLTGQPLWGYPLRTVGIFALLAIGPQILGHSAFNWALGHLSAVFVTLTILGEPVG